jgi:hypothetical protein
MPESAAVTRSRCPLSGKTSEIVQSALEERMVGHFDQLYLVPRCELHVHRPRRGPECHALPRHHGGVIALRSRLQLRMHARDVGIAHDPLRAPLSMHEMIVVERPLGTSQPSPRPAIRSRALRESNTARGLPHGSPPSPGTGSATTGIRAAVSRKALPCSLSYRCVGEGAPLLRCFWCA